MLGIHNFGLFLAAGIPLNLTPVNRAAGALFVSLGLRVATVE